MTVMNFDLEDGLTPISITIAYADAERFMAFLAECQALKDKDLEAENAQLREQIKQQADYRMKCNELELVYDQLAAARGDAKRFSNRIEALRVERDALLTENTLLCDQNTALDAKCAELEKQPVAKAMQTVIDAMRSDPDYAWSWHCNIAMAFVDAGGDHYTGNQGAARFMRILASVEPAHELPTVPEAELRGKRVALSDEQIDRLGKAIGNGTLRNFARAIEAAHGITGEAL